MKIFRVVNNSDKPIPYCHVWYANDIYIPGILSPGEYLQSRQVRIDFDRNWIRLGAGDYGGEIVFQADSGVEFLQYEVNKTTP